MKDERIVDAFDAVKPDDEAKARMLAAIISEGASEERVSESVPVVPESKTPAQERKVVEVDFAAERRKRQRRRRFAGFGAAACLVLVVVIASSLGLGTSKSSDVATEGTEIAQTNESSYAAKGEMEDGAMSAEVPTVSAQPELFASYDSAVYELAAFDDPRFADVELGESIGTVAVGESPELDSSATPSVEAFSLAGFKPIEAFAVKAADLGLDTDSEFVIFAISE